MSDLEFLKEALHLARTHSREGEAGPFGAVVVRAGEVVGRGWNRVVEDHDPTAHAEILAIRDAAHRLGTHVLDACVLYSSCEPCPMCLGAIYWARIPRVVYAAAAEDAAAAGFDDAIIAQESRLTWKERALESRRDLEADGRRVLEEWRRTPKRKAY